MGMEVAFQPGADFSRMFESVGPWIHEVKQKSFVRVDELGTEVAAVTSVAMTDSAPPTVRADRPFLFAIRERLSGTTLFVGLIVEAPRLAGCRRRHIGGSDASRRQRRVSPSAHHQPARPQTRQSASAATASPARRRSSASPSSW